MKKINQSAVDHIAFLVNNRSPNGKVIVTIFQSFGVEIDPEDISEGGYCALTKGSFCEKYANIINEEGNLVDFLIKFLSPSNYINMMDVLEEKMERLNQYLLFDDISLELYDNNRKVKVSHVDQSNDGSSNSYFTKSEDIKSVILNSLNSAEEFIWISIFQLTSNDIFKVLENKSKQNIDVQVILDDNQVNRNFMLNKDLDFLVLYTKGFQNGDGVHHDKYYIIDNKILLNGSMNGTFSGLNKNSEHIVIDDYILHIKEFKSDFVQTKRQILKEFYKSKNK